MNKREFLKASLLTTALTAQIPAIASTKKEKDTDYRHWVWIDPHHDEQESEIRQRYEKFYSAGIRGIFFDADSEKHFRAARAAKLQAHRWIWTLNRGEESLLKAHPEWYAVNRLGDSCAQKPPYVNYYRWLCPSREEVHAYLENEVHSALRKEYVDGIHLDYVRYCDVILPVNLWDNYGIEQNQELPQYDYCYCDVCKDKFQEQHGVDIRNVKYPDQNLSWRKFRYDRVTTLVNRLAAVAATYKKPITAAVFPTPEVARRIVRQDWTNWNLKGICPMIYHGFYKEDVKWIGDAVAEGIRFLNKKFPLYAGLYLPDFKSMEELKQGINYALSSGASGVSLFGNVNDDVLEVLKSVRKA